jgi:His-Xaa-Ser system protein HxsD
VISLQRFDWGRTISDGESGEMAMNTIEIVLNGGLFSVDVIARTAHRYTGDYFVETVSTTSDVLVRLTPKTDSLSFHLLAERFRNDALDERLRERVRTETSELHTALVRAALHQAAPPLTTADQKQ